MRQIKKNFRLHKVLFFITLISSTVAAVPNVSIDSIDANKAFPKIEIQFSVKGSPLFDVSAIDEHSVDVFEDGLKVNFLQLKRLNEIKEASSYLFLFAFRKGISGRDLYRLKTAAREIIHNLNENDNAAVFSISSNDDLNTIKNFTRNKSILLTGIDKITGVNKKAQLNYAISDAIVVLKEIKTDKKVVVIFTDGRISGSNVSDDIISTACNNSISVYLITIRNSSRIKQLNRVAKLTGAKSIIVNDKAINTNIFRSIIRSDNNGKFVLTYSSQLIPDDKIHKLELKIKSAVFQDNADSTFRLDRKPFLYNNNSVVIVILLACIIIILISVLIILIIILRKNGLSITGRFSPHTRGNNTIEKVIELEKQDKRLETETLSSSDPDYNYSHAWLIEKEGPKSGEKFPIQWDECTIGRSNENTIVINDQGVSPRHARIKRVRNGYYIFDHISDNGTYLNDKKLLRPKLLNDWDEIIIGRTTLIFRGSKKQLK